MNEHIKTCHDAYQRALLTQSGDGVIRIFEKLVGSPPLPSDEKTYKVYIHMLQDLRQMENFERRYPLAIVAFGSARLSVDNPYYLLAVQVGEQLAEKGYLVRTGAGPGVMDAVPVGWKRGSLSRAASIVEDDADQQQQQQTQGVRIYLPFEQAVSPSIDTNTMMKTFVIRRTALIWNSRGILVFPGGLGTVNELFEAWLGAANDKVPCPIVVIPYTTFWKPLLDAIKAVAVINNDERKKKGMIDESDFNLIQHADTVDEAVRLVQQPMRPKEPGTQFTLREKLIYLRHELGRGLTTVSSLVPALVFMGGGSKSSLSRTDPEIQFISKLTKEILIATSFGIRLGVSGLINRIVTESSTNDEVASSSSSSAEIIGSDSRIQRIFMTYETNIEDEEDVDDIDVQLESRSAHCESLLSNAKAAFFLPGDISTLNVLFALVCEIQTQRRPRMPVFLIGTAFWQPIVDGLRDTLLLKGVGDEQYVKSTDLDIITVLGTTQQDLSNVTERLGSSERGKAVD